MPPPKTEILEIETEQCFAGSYGDEGYAGADPDEDGYGDL